MHQFKGSSILNIYSKKENYEISVPQFLSLEEYVETQFGIIFCEFEEIRERTPNKVYTKQGFCKESGSRSKITFKTVDSRDVESESVIAHMIQTFQGFSRLRSKYIHGYDKLLVKTNPNLYIREIMLITEIIDGVNINNLVGDFSDGIRERHYEAVTTSLLELFQTLKVDEAAVSKPETILQENGDIKCVFNLLENMFLTSYFSNLGNKNGSDLLNNNLNSTDEMDRSETRTFLTEEMLNCVMNTPMTEGSTNMTSTNSSSYTDDDESDIETSEMKLYDEWFGQQSRLHREFKVLGLAGEGGFGHVYKATSFLDNQTYAIKRIKLKQDTLREAEILSELKHPNIVRYYDYWKHGPMLYIKMELVLDGTLKQYMERFSPRFGRDPLSVGKLICKGLRYLHDKSIIHRDIKPANILVQRNNGDEMIVKLTDFGFSKHFKETDVYKGYDLGTRPYRAPEELSSLPSDIFSLGTVFIELFFCEDIRDFEVEKHKIKKNIYDEDCDNYCQLYMNYASDALDSMDETISSYEDFVAFIEPNLRWKIQVYLEGLMKVSSCFDKRAPFEHWIRKLLSDCIKEDAEDRPKISTIQKALYIAQCIEYVYHYTFTNAQPYEMESRSQPM